MENKMDNEDFLTKNGWKWTGTQYRLNGDGYGTFKHTSGVRMKIGARESTWDGKESFKKACIRAFIKRLKEKT